LDKKAIDDRRELIVAGNADETVAFATKHWIENAKQALDTHGTFYVALSGGSTPKAIYQKLASEHGNSIDWSNVHLFWSDERSVPPEDEKSNYRMAMEAGFKNLPLSPENIHRMHAEENIDANAEAYAQDIQTTLRGSPFDLMMLGMGDDGHTASLFPGTDAVKVYDKLVVANFVPAQDTWRMTMTLPCINGSRSIAFYALGANKKARLQQVLSTECEEMPASLIGTKETKASWIVDTLASCDGSIGH